MPDSPAIIYLYDRCDTCRKAVRFLEAQGIPFRSLPIRKQPPTVAELRLMLASVGGLRRLFNTSGLDYRSMNLKERLPELTAEEALELLRARGNLVKRPFLLLPDGGGTTGFDEAEWKRLFKLES
jgi:arsenate reductase (glutaredoxin)